MKLEEIVKGIVEHKDDFINLDESTSSPNLRSIVRNIVDQYLKDLNEAKLTKYATPKEIQNIARGYVKQAVEDLETYYGVEFDDRQKNAITMWLSFYTSEIIKALTDKDILV